MSIGVTNEDIRPTVFRLYRRSWSGLPVVAWQGEGCYLSDVLEQWRDQGGRLDQIVLAEFDRLQGGLRVFSQRELLEEIEYAKAEHT